MSVGVSTTPDVSRRRIAALAWPLAMNGLVTVAVSTNDVVLLGRVSPTVLASAVVATSVLTVLVLSLTSVGVATQIEAPRAFGAGDDRAGRGAAESTVRAALMVGAVPWLACGAAAPWLAGVLGQGTADPAIAATYLRITLLGVPFAVIAAVLRSYATANGTTRVVLVAGVVTAAADVAASLGLRSWLGWQGVAAGTVIGYAVGALLLVAWARRLPAPRRPRWARLWTGGERAVLRLAWPEILLALFSSAAGLVVVIVLAGADPSVLAASRLLDVQVSLAWVLLYAGGQGLLTVLGEAEGAGRTDLFTRAIRNAAPLFAATALLLLVTGGLLAQQVVGAIGGDEVASVVGHLGWLAWGQVLWQAACVLALTVCRASRDTRAALIASLVGEYAVFLPVGLVLCRWQGWGLPGVLVAHQLFWAAFVAIATLRAFRARRSALDARNARGMSERVDEEPAVAVDAGRDTEHLGRDRSLEDVAGGAVGHQSAAVEDR